MVLPCAHMHRKNGKDQAPRRSLRAGARGDIRWAELLQWVQRVLYQKF